MDALRPTQDLKTLYWRNMFAAAPSRTETTRFDWRKQLSHHGKTPVSVALGGAVLVLLLLLLVCPPFVQARNDSDHHLQRGPIDLTRLLLWTLLGFVAILVLPLVVP